MKLSELDPAEVEVVPEAGGKAAPLKLSDVHPNDVQVLSPPEEDPATSAPAAVSTGLINGATMNFAPRIGAMGKTAMDAITGVSGPLAGGSVQDLIDEYNAQHEMLQENFAKAAKAHPKLSLAGNVVGGGAALGALGPAAMSTTGLATTGALTGAGHSRDLTDLPETAKDAAIGATTNVVGGKLIQAAAPYVAGAVKSGAEKLSGVLGNKAEELAVNAVGATGREASRFKPDTGRELLDRGIVGFGDSPGDIAAKAGEAITTAEEGVQNTLNEKLAGTTVDRNRVIQYLKDKIAALSGDESKDALVGQLQDKVKSVEGKIVPGLTEETANSSLPIAEANKIKRGFYENSNYLNPDADKANKVAGSAYRQAVQEAATEASPELGQKLASDNATQSLLIDVKKAAERRAGVLAQSPKAGLLPMASYAAAGKIGLAANAVRSRISSSLAVSADKLGKLVASTPGMFGKFAPALKAAAARGGASLGATDYILQQTNPEYREQRNKIFDPENHEVDQPVLAEEGSRAPGSR